MSVQRRKVVVLASSIACWAAFGPVLLSHFKDWHYYPFLIGAWTLLVVCILAYTISEFFKLKRSEHE